MKPTLIRRAVAEFIGTAFLVSAVVGSGIMAEHLFGGGDLPFSRILLLPEQR